MKLPRFRRPVRASDEAEPPHGRLTLAVGALGIVYGDIGTSPLYAVNFLFSSQTQIARSSDNILGGISLVVWALTLVITIKYATLVLRADNDGEGGVFALYGLLDKFTRRGMPLLLWVLLLGAGLLLGDGMITPAISVLSAVEGVRVATPMFDKAVIPITIGILTALFALQFKGTGGVGRIFGPVMIVWFFVIAGLGLFQIVRHLEILKASDPFLGLAFLARCGWRTGLLVLGAIVLVLTGGEAMYADLGHFGARPIRLSWFGLAYPCLILNYLGQGAFLLGGDASHNLFYGMVPTGFILPMVALATVATVIASQALISGAFSLITQAIALGLFPRLVVKHTHHAQAGEVYVPFVNRILYVGCVLLVLGFGSSAALGAAYGLAESGVMIITSTAMFSVARRYWNWSLAQSGGLFGAVALVDGAFVVANSLKVLEGGWVPLSIGLFVFFVMATWRWGRKITYAGYSAKHTMSMSELYRADGDPDGAGAGSPRQRTRAGLDAASMGPDGRLAAQSDFRPGRPPEGPPHPREPLFGERLGAERERQHHPRPAQVRVHGGAECRSGARRHDFAQGDRSFRRRA
jgi:KUP system potassium uptake protein